MTTFLMLLSEVTSSRTISTDRHQQHLSEMDGLDTSCQTGCNDASLAVALTLTWTH
jgi:hypothetical protein